MSSKPTDDDGWGDAAEASDSLKIDDSWGESSTEADSNASTAASPSTDTDASPSTDTDASPSTDTDTDTDADADASPGTDAGASLDSSTVSASSVVSDSNLDSDSAVSVGADDGWSQTEDDWAVDDDPDTELAAAAGVAKKKKKAKKKSGPSRLSSRTKRRLIIAAIAAVIILTFIITSSLNSRHLYLVCGDNDVRAERGRFFPWGRAALTGEKWTAIKSDDQCAEREVGSLAELEGAFLALVLARADSDLGNDPPTDIEGAAALLSQASKLARDPSRGAARDQIAALENDVEAWRAEAEFEKAIASMEAARSRLSEAAGNGRHVSGTKERAVFIESLIELAKDGVVPPGSTAAPPSPPNEKPTSTGAEPAVPTVLVDPPKEPASAAPTPSKPPPKPIPTGGVLL